MIQQGKPSRLRLQNIKTHAGHLLALGLIMNQLHAQVGGTANVEIDFPPLIVLYFFGDIEMEITTAALAEIVTGRQGDTAIGEDVIKKMTTVLPGDLAISGTKNFINPIIVNLDFPNFWGVRAVANSEGADVRVKVVLKNGILKGPGQGNTLTLNSVSIRSPPGSGSFANFTDITPAGVGTLIRGDVRLAFDLSAVAREGHYSDGDFTITATSL